jgi:RNA methyltransferase, TrmH family
MITSTANPQIKLIRKLKDRKYRAETGLFFIEGIRIVIEALEESKEISQLIIAKDLLKNQNSKMAVEMAERRRVPIIEISAEVFESISSKDGPQGLAAIVNQNLGTLLDAGGVLEGIYLALYEVADPGNLGTIIRTLDGMGGKGVILIDQCTDPYDPTSIRASMGTIFSKKIIKTGSEEFCEWVKGINAVVIGTSDSAKSNYRDFSFPKDMVLLMGSEREGLPILLQEICKTIVGIPMKGKADSLNLAVASSIVLYEIFHQSTK